MIKNLLIASGIIIVLAIGGVAVADTNKFLGVLSGKCSYTEDGNWVDQKAGPNNQLEKPPCSSE
jgi:hypothetical protein